MLHRSPDILLLGAGYRIGAEKDIVSSVDAVYQHTRENLALVKLLQDQKITDEEAQPREKISAKVLACNFWLLACSPDEPEAGDAWFQADGSVLPIVEALIPDRAGITATGNAGRGDSAPSFDEPDHCSK